MLTGWRNLFFARVPQRPATWPRPGRRRVRLELETLEERCVPTVTYHGGALLPHVEVQALFYGSAWNANPTLAGQAHYLDGFLGNFVNSSFMDMLSEAGYGVGRGTFTGGTVLPAVLNSAQYLQDSTLQAVLQSGISNGVLASPDANRVYVIYVEPNVVVTKDGGTSLTDFLGYHWAFAGHDRAGNPAVIHYAVIAYPGGSVGNADVPWLGAADEMTQVTSHEVAEAATDPNAGYSTLGWWDDAYPSEGEIADLANAQTVYLNGYAVQRIADPNDQPMTPAGATPRFEESFVLKQDGTLWKHSAAGWTYLTNDVVGVSNQGIDDEGEAMVDVIKAGGYAFEYHEGSGWVFLGGGVQSAQAGQEVSYVLFSNGTLSEYKDVSDSWQYIFNRVASINAGTDKLGVNCVDLVFTWSAAWEYSDSIGWTYLGWNVQSVNAGQRGIADLIYAKGDYYWYDDSTGEQDYIDTGVAQVATGVDANGNYMIDVLYRNGNLFEYRAGYSAWQFLASNVKALAKGRAGIVDIVFSSGSAYEHDLAGWHFLADGVAEAV